MTFRGPLALKRQASGPRTSNVCRAKTRKSAFVDKSPGSRMGVIRERSVRKIKGVEDGQVIGLGMDSALTVKSAVRVTV